VSQTYKIGLASIVPTGTVIVHSSMIGRKGFGRVSDLLSAWLVNEFDLNTPLIASFRMLTSALLESLPRKEKASTLIEMAVFDGQIVIAARAECGLDVDATQVERTFTQFWLHSGETQIFKKVIHPADRIEVRYQEKTRIVEWRVFRKIEESGEFDASGSFSVIEDSRDRIEQEDAQYVDLGDLPHKTWLEDVYRSANKASSSGDLILSDGESQGEDEMIRMKVRSELGEIERVVQEGRVPTRADESSDGPEITVVAGEPVDATSNDKTLVSGQATPMEESFQKVIEGIKNEQGVEDDLVRALEVLKVESQRNAMNAEQFRVRNAQFEELLSRKEKLLLKKDADMATMVQRHQRELLRLSSEQQSNPFRIKAIEMFERVKTLQEENRSMERVIHQLRRANSEALEQAARSNIQDERKVSAEETEQEQDVSRSNLTEDLEKKIERLQRALESEKSKTKAFLERALAAEKEAQSSGPIISDLEAKVEHVLKTSLQYKKDIDAMKLKLVQSEQEKNKLKNELLNAQSQIKTLQKRQAA
jgi:hypothetical protein